MITEGFRYIYIFIIIILNLLIVNLLVNLCCLLIQATLGLGSSAERCILQCFKGHKNPIFCVLCYRIRMSAAP
jgi:hypothetical protein